MISLGLLLAVIAALCDPNNLGFLPSEICGTLFILGILFTFIGIEKVSKDA